MNRHEETALDASGRGLDAAAERRPVDVDGRRRADHRGGHLGRDGGQSGRRPAAAQRVRHRIAAGPKRRRRGCCPLKIHFFS